MLPFEADRWVLAVREATQDTFTHLARLLLLAAVPALGSFVLRLARRPAPAKGGPRERT